MARPDPITTVHFPIRLLTIALVLTAVAFVWFGWVIFDSSRNAKTARDQSTRMEELRGVILRFGEVLGGAVRLAVTTGDSKWEARYRLFEPQLDAAITEVKRFATNTSRVRAAAQTDEANLKLVAMETRAFALVRAGRLDDAHAVVFGPEYEKEEQIYAQGSALFIVQIRREVDQRERQSTRINFLLMIGAVVVLAISFAAWLSVVRGLQRWRTELEQAVSERQQAEQALRRAHDELEVRIEQRTAELARTNQALLNEVGERERAQSFLNSVVEHLPIPVFIKEAKELRFVLWNKAGEKLTGVSSAEMIGKNDFDFLPQDAAERNVAKDRAALAGQGVLEIPEEILQTQAHGARLVHVWKVPISDATGQPAFLLVIAEDVTERKRAQAELENIHKQLVEASRQGGMAEIATNVLHNVGNVLNSVNISAGLVVESVKRSRISSLGRVVDLLRDHAMDLGEFMTNDPRGKHVPAHLAQLSEHLLAEQKVIGSELDSLQRNVEHIKEIVAMQQSYATFGGVKEMIDAVNLVEDSMRMDEGSLSRHGVEVVREFEKVPPMNVEKHKILQILVNLLSNAKHACQDSERMDKRLTVRVTNGDRRVKISVNDNGIGIPPENLTRIFNHGFTTRKDGHGFGLHSGALAAKEMGGSLGVHSEGPGQGATFTLELPLPDAGDSRE